MTLPEQFLNERAWSKGPGIPDGADIEVAVLGKPTIPPRERIGDHLPFREAVAYARKYPPPPLGRPPLIKALQSNLKDLVSDTAQPVRFFSAVGTPLDIYHGVDAFFAQGERIATLDVSLREKSSYKADALLVVHFDGEGRPVADPKELLAVAQTLAQALERKSRPH